MSELLDGFGIYAPAQSGDPEDKFVVFGFACSDESTDVETGTDKIQIPVPYDFTASGVFIYASDAPTGSDFILDANFNSSSIFSVLPTIENGENSSLDATTQPVLSKTSFTKGDVLAVDFDQVGSTNPGKGIKFFIQGTRT
jgi:hypothetical protein